MVASNGASVQYLVTIFSKCWIGTNAISSNFSFTFQLYSSHFSPDITSLGHNVWALHIPLFLIHSITSTHKAHTLFYHGATIAETANTHTAHIMKMYTRFIRVSYVRTDALVLENHITGISCNNVRNACRVFFLFFFRMSHLSTATSRRYLLLRHSYQFHSISLNNSIR